MSGREGRAVTAQCARRMSTAPPGPARFLGHQFNESVARLSPQGFSIPCQGEPSSTAHTVSVCLSQKPHLGLGGATQTAPWLRGSLKTFAKTPPCSVARS